MPDTAVMDEPIKDGTRVWAAVDVITERDQRVIGLDVNVTGQCSQRIEAAVDVANCEMSCHETPYQRVGRSFCASRTTLTHILCRLKGWPMRSVHSMPETQHALSANRPRAQTPTGGRGERRLEVVVGCGSMLARSNAHFVIWRLSAASNSRIRSCLHVGAKSPSAGRARQPSLERHIGP